MNDGLVYIYALVDPRNDRVRYVGFARNVLQRIGTHLINAPRSDKPKDRWIGELFTLGMLPKFAVLEEIAHSDAAQRERWWIKEFRADYPDLLNRSIGGEGIKWSRWRRPSKDMSHEALEKLVQETKERWHREELARAEHVAQLGGEDMDDDEEV